MPKETVRYPDALVAGVEAVVAEAEAFESKSEFYRFASDFLLSVLDEDHEPTVLGYGDIVADLESTSGSPLVPRSASDEPTTGPFLAAYIQVRRHLLYDDVESARAVVAERYDAADREALLLDEIIGRERFAGDPTRPPTNASGPTAPDTGEADRPRDRNPDTDGSGNEPAGVASEDGDGSTERRGRPAEATRETDGGTDGTPDAEDD
jgi:Arc/MetJ-type ribon-helix-helix transcriptional regulator